MDVTTSHSPAAPATTELMSLVYNELHRICTQLMFGERPGHTLQATALVHEVILRVGGETALSKYGTAQFLAIAAHVARQHLVDHARSRGREKRGGGVSRVSLETVDPVADGSDVDVLAVHEALEELSRLNPRHAQVAEMRWFSGMTVGEIAEVLGVSVRTVSHDWRLARAWLQIRLSDDDGRHPGRVRAPDKTT